MKGFFLHIQLLKSLPIIIWWNFQKYLVIKLSKSSFRIFEQKDPGRLQTGWKTQTQSDPPSCYPWQTLGLCVCFYYPNGLPQWLHQVTHSPTVYKGFLSSASSPTVIICWLFFFFWLCCLTYGILVPQPDIEPGPSAVGVLTTGPWRKSWWVGC